MSSFFDLPEACTRPHAPEYFQTLLSGPAGLRVERIISHGHVTPDNEWYDQEQDEWVLVLEGSATLGFADGSERTLSRGESLFLPRHLKHRVLFSSTPCFWLAVHGSLNLPEQTSAAPHSPAETAGSPKV